MENACMAEYVCCFSKVFHAYLVKKETSYPLNWTLLNLALFPLDRMYKAWDMYFH